MPMTNYERQKRWREKHRGLANLRRREHYKRSNGDSVEQPVKQVVAVVAPKSKIEELRALMAAESAKPPQQVSESTVAPTVYRDDYGRVISEAAWNELQDRKAKAAGGGYVIDEFSQ